MLFNFISVYLLLKKVICLVTLSLPISDVNTNYHMYKQERTFKKGSRLITITLLVPVNFLEPSLENSDNFLQKTACKSSY